MRVKNTGLRPVALNGVTIGIGEEKDVEKSDITGLTLEIVKESKSKKNKE
jgi:hypothetical protein